MSVNFFESACTESSINHEEFGLCDDENGTKAYSDHVDQTKWIATVKNSNRENISFTAIDNCIDVFREDGTQEKRCDGMLTYPDNIVFVELKNQRKDWMRDGLIQLETTIQLFAANHALSAIKHKRGFVSNKKHPAFQVLQPELKRRFFDQYRVRISAFSTIDI